MSQAPQQRLNVRFTKGVAVIGFADTYLQTEDLIRDLALPLGLLRGQRTSAGFRPAGTRRRNVDSERAASHDWLTGTLSLFRRHRRFLRNALDHAGHRESRPKSHCHNDQ